MAKQCDGGAGKAASLNAGGGKDDWFLPSKDELNEIRLINFWEFPDKYRLSTILNQYWSSSQDQDSFTPKAWKQYLKVGFRGGEQFLQHLFEKGSVRPVRAF